VNRHADLTFPILLSFDGPFSLLLIFHSSSPLSHDLAFLPPELLGCSLGAHGSLPGLFDSPYLAAQVVSWRLQEPKFVHSLFSSIARRYDLANHLLSGGLDFLWRRRAAAVAASWHPSTLLDLATGSGDLALAIERACPHTQVTGADFCEPMLERAREKGLRRTVVADALHLPFPDCSFDCVTVAFGLRNMESWPAALREMSRVLNPCGHLLILDFSLPGPPLRAPYRFYLHHILPVVAGIVTGKKSAYRYLGVSIEEFPAGAAMLSLIEKCGFTAAKCQPLTGGIVSLYTAAKAASSSAPAQPNDPRDL
jgi:demethylmenaquinone methyltransferase/2-methoxy-6-polyprenyl-1,4-benzoquinol methylase